MQRIVLCVIFLLCELYFLALAKLQMLLKKKSRKQYFALLAFCKLMAHTLFHMVTVYIKRKILTTLCAWDHTLILFLLFATKQFLKKTFLLFWLLVLATFASYHMDCLALSQNICIAPYTNHNIIDFHYE